jgi:hypothetical protein
MKKHGLLVLPVILVVGSLLLGCALLPTSAPELQLAARDPIVARGECTILEWVVEGAEGSPVFLNGEEVDSLGWRQVCPQETTAYELVVGAPGGPYEERAIVVVEGEPGPGVSSSPAPVPPTSVPATPTTLPSAPSPTAKPPTPTTPPPPPAPTSTPPPSPTPTTPPPSPTPSSTSTPPLHTIELINHSGQAIWYVYFSLSTSSEWGDDQLGAAAVQPGLSYTWQVPPGIYDLKAEDSAHNILDARFSQSIAGPYQWVIEPVAPAVSGNLVLTNNSGQTICFVYISLSTDASWGSDQLAAGETVGPGQSRGWEVPPGTYDLKAEDCLHNVLDQRYNQSIAALLQWTIP